MAKAVMIVSLTSSLMRSSETWLNGSVFTEAVIFAVLTAFLLIVLSPNVVTSARDDD